MSSPSSTDGEHWNCPTCGSVMYPQGAAPGVYWCEECQHEYWREHEDWWRCDESGKPERVEAVADGGTAGSDHHLKQQYVEKHGISNWWWEKANENLDKWGWQNPETLLLATQEELGELTRAYLEYQHERGKRTTVEDELDDLAALMYQLHWVLVEEMP